MGFKEKLKKAEIGYGKSYGENKNIYIYGAIAEADGFPPDSFLELDDPYTSPVDPTINRNFNTYVLKDNYRLAAYLKYDNGDFQSQLQRVSRSCNGKTTIGDNVSSRGHWQIFFASRLKYKKKFKSQSSIEFSLPVEFFDYGVNSNDTTGDKGRLLSHPRAG